jgi:hypothetical protein
VNVALVRHLQQKVRRADKHISVNFQYVDSTLLPESIETHVMHAAVNRARVLQSSPDVCVALTDSGSTISVDCPQHLSHLELTPQLAYSVSSGSSVGVGRFLDSVPEDAAELIAGLKETAAAIGQEEAGGDEESSGSGGGEESSGAGESEESSGADGDEGPSGAGGNKRSREDDGGDSGAGAGEKGSEEGGRGQGAKRPR